MLLQGSWLALYWHPVLEPSLFRGASQQWHLLGPAATSVNTRRTGHIHTMHVNIQALFANQLFLQVLDFITNLTISVHVTLLRKHTQPGACRSLPPAFGARAARFTTASTVDQQQQAACICGNKPLAAVGAQLDTSALQMLREQRQQRKKPKERRVAVFEVPAPVLKSFAAGSSTLSIQRQVLQSWDLQP